MPLRYALLLAALLTAPSALAQTPGSCEPGTARAELSLSDVRAQLYNDGTSFAGSGGAGYVVPQESGVSSIYSNQLWIGGKIDGEVRAAATDFNRPEMWPGPLEEGATLPNPGDCSAYDRIYRVSTPELAAYEQTGVPLASLAEWPVGLGAPAVDASGAPVVPTNREQVLDLAAGERPVIYGTETAFWVMNDVGGEHVTTGSLPLGIEVRVLAFSVNDPGEAALDQSTFYRFEIVNRNTRAITDLRLGWFLDPDLGGFDDDYIGSDAERGMLYIYNADNLDRHYGAAPPALGVDVLSGAHGTMWTDNNFPFIDIPYTAARVYRSLQSVWTSSVPLTRNDLGYNPGEPGLDVTTWYWDGDPVTQSFWSEIDAQIEPGAQPNAPGDRSARVIAALPATLQPGASHTVDLGVVYARGTDHLDSVTELRAASDLVQARYDDGSLFETTNGDLGLPPLAAPDLLSPADGTAYMPPEVVVLDWQTVADADGYRVEYSASPTFSAARVQTADAPPVTVAFSELPQGTFEPIYWRVTPLNANGDGPTSGVRSFTYGFEFAADVQPLSNGQPAFLEVAGPGGADPCGDAAGSTFGCAEAGGNAVYVFRGETTPDPNGTGVYTLTSLGAGGPEDVLADFAPNEFEIRFTAAGSIAYHVFTDTPGHPTHRVPFEVWDIGEVPVGADGVPSANDPADDVQMVPILFSDRVSEDAEACEFRFGRIPAAESPLGVPLTDRIYAYYPTTTYADYDAVAAPLVDAAPDGCLADGSADVAPLIDFGRRRPIQRLTVADLTGSGSVSDLEGAVIRFYTTATMPVADETLPAPSALALTVFPNPSRGAARVRFTLPTAGAARVRVVDVLGREVATLADGDHRVGAHEVSLPRGLSAGVYVVTVEAGAERSARTLTVVR